jgi:hypothetical protein
MSADNWAVCPRCLHSAKSWLEAKKAEVRERYGRITIEEWAELSTMLDEEVDEDAVRTFREDYEFYGAETGTLEISYRGECTKCGLKHEHEDSKTFWTPPE